MKALSFVVLLGLSLAAAQRLPSADDVPLSVQSKVDDTPANAELEQEADAATEDDEVVESPIEVTLPDGEKVELSSAAAHAHEDALSHELATADTAASHTAVDSGAEAKANTAPAEAAAVAEPAAAATDAAGATPAATRASQQRARGGRRGRNGKNKRCRVPGCLRCSTTDRTQCMTCRRGFALTDEMGCAKCSVGCAACTTLDTCDSCMPGFTNVLGQCKPCAAHCLKCDAAGEGGCNECGARRMLHVRLELHGEVHECLPCGDGCRACSEEEGCTACENSFYYPLANRNGCALSWFRIGLLVGTICLIVGGLIFCLASEDFEDPHSQAYREARRAQAYRERDTTSVVHKPFGSSGGRGGGEMRSRRERSSPPREETRQSSAPSSAYSQHLLPGYSGIDIVDQPSY